MTFAELQDAVLERFEESQRTNVKRWLNLFYGLVWGLERWSFRVAETYVTVTVGDTAIANLPTNIGKVEGLLNWQGDRLTALSRDTYNDFYRYMILQGQTALPEAYAIVNSVPVVGPPSSEDSDEYRLEYVKRLTQLVDDDDEPETPDEFDWLLVLGATEYGQMSTQDPTAALSQPGVAAGIETLRRDFMTDIDVAAQWGRQ